MPSILDALGGPAKILIYGKPGTGKTGAQASLVAAGYNLRIIDTDKGVRPLYSLLTDPRYPYAKIIAARNIDLRTAVRYIPIDTKMKSTTVRRKTPSGNYTEEKLLAPSASHAWDKVIDMIDEWKDGDMNLGPARDWGPECILSLDSFSTLATCTYYHSQALNGRLGAREEGYDYQRDIGGAQAQLRRALELLYDSSFNTNVIVISHVTWVDESKGFTDRPKAVASDDGKGVIVSNPEGYPSAIGRALSPQIGKYFNDMFTVNATGSGENVRRMIYTVPRDGVMAKNSVHLEKEYPVTYGLASIFASLRGQTQPQDIIDACKAPEPKKVIPIVQKPTSA